MRKGGASAPSFRVSGYRPRPFACSGSFRVSRVKRTDSQRPAAAPRPTRPDRQPSTGSASRRHRGTPAERGPPDGTMGGRRPNYRGDQATGPERAGCRVGIIALGKELGHRRFGSGARFGCGSLVADVGAGQVDQCGTLGTRGRCRPPGAGASTPRSVARGSVARVSWPTHRHVAGGPSEAREDEHLFLRVRQEPDRLVHERPRRRPLTADPRVTRRPPSTRSRRTLLGPDRCGPVTGAAGVPFLIVSGDVCR